MEESRGESNLMPFSQERIMQGMLFGVSCAQDPHSLFPLQFWGAMLCPALSWSCTLVLLSLFFKDDISQGFPFVAALSPLEHPPHSNMGCECSLQEAAPSCYSMWLLGKQCVRGMQETGVAPVGWKGGDCHHTCTICGKVLQ